MRRIHQHPTPRACQVCGSTQVVTDEVQNGRMLLLAECGRCEYRWTQWSEAFDAYGTLDSEPLRVAHTAADPLADAA